MASKSKLAGIDDFFAPEIQIAEAEEQLKLANQKIAEQEELIKQLGISTGGQVTPLSVADISLPIERVVRDPNQVRRYFSPAKITELARSIAEVGIRERLWVRPLPSGDYQLIAGERRYRAAIEVGLKTVPVVILDIDDQLALKLSLIENLQREDLNPVEETEGILQLISLRLNTSVEETVGLLYKMRNYEEGRRGENVFPQDKTDAIQDIFTALGRFSWQSFISARLPLRNLPEDVLEVLRRGEIEYTKARAIARIKEEGARKILLKKVIELDLSLSEIKAEIKSMKPVPPASLRTRFKEVSSRVMKLPPDDWKDPKRAKKIERLLEQLEQFLT
jgi:ParB family chromosome partitioning protein